jgi:hypothetical protein
MSPTKLETVFQGMARLRRGLHYYFLEVIARPDGQIIHSAYTEWVGFTERNPQREIRKGSLVRPESFISQWEKFGIPYVIVSTPPQLIAYLFTGGIALVEKALAEEHFPNETLANEVVPDGPPGAGFKGVRSLPEELLFRAPRPKLRMKVLKRDDYRCRICGRRSSDYSDVELHVHHIRPWATGGITEEQNLITLCHTCHMGLEPHQELRLFYFLKKPATNDPPYASELRSGTLRYQELIREAYQRLEGSSALKATRRTESPRKFVRK